MGNYLQRSCVLHDSCIVLNVIFFSENTILLKHKTRYLKSLTTKAKTQHQGGYVTSQYFQFITQGNMQRLVNKSLIISNTVVHACQMAHA